MDLMSNNIVFQPSNNDTHYFDYFHTLLCYTYILKLHQESDNCPICLEQLSISKFNKTLHCHHTFHKNCIKKWITYTKNNNNFTNCPLCRTKL